MARISDLPAFRGSTAQAARSRGRLARVMLSPTDMACTSPPPGGPPGSGPARGRSARPAAAARSAPPLPPRTRPCGLGVQPHQALEQLGAPGAHQPVDARRSRPRRTARDTSSTKQPAAPARGRRRFSTSSSSAAEPGGRSAGQEVGRAAAHHLLARSSGRSTSATRASACDLAVAQHGDVVADPHQLLQPVRDVDDRHAPRASGRR